MGAGDLAPLECLPSMHQSWVLSLVPHKLGMIAHAHKPTVLAAEAGGSGGQGHLWLSMAFEVSLGH